MNLHTPQQRLLKDHYVSIAGFGHIELIVTICVLAIIGGAGLAVFRHEHKMSETNTEKTSLSIARLKYDQTQPMATATSVTIPSAIDPVSPQAIPLGDGKVSTQPQAGYVDTCMSASSSGGGAETEGPWIDNANATWNSTTKIAVQGSVNWPSAYYSVTLSGNTRVIKTNDLPINHPTGVFPISQSDPAHAYDSNPNHIVAQPTTWDLPADPVAASKPSCTNGGPVGILSDGVFLFNALDAEDRDAGAHEVLDNWQGHPDMDSMYHHHTIPNFMLDAASSRSSATLVGYAIDGYGIYVERDANGNLLTNANLDACHGRTSEVMWDGKMIAMYHYDATLEYPYTVGCFHGTPIKTNVAMNMSSMSMPPPGPPKN